jgi:hypothetical protein
MEYFYKMYFSSKQKEKKKYYFNMYLKAYFKTIP